MKRKRGKVLATFGIAAIMLAAFCVAEVCSYAAAKPEVYDFTFEGQRWRSTTTHCVRWLPLREWRFGTITACGSNGGSTSRMFGPLELERSSWNTQLSGAPSKGTPAW